MFIGHYAVALAAKRYEPKVSLPVLFGAVQLLDIVWPLLIVLGVEHAAIVPGITAASPLDLYDIPYSHSLITSLLWSALCAAPWLARRRVREGLVVAGCVFSHFVLDVITHRPDMPLAPGSGVRFGFGLWNALVPAVVVELAMFVAAVVFYARGTRATGKAGSIGLWALAIVLVGIWLSGVFAPPPPDIGVVAWSALLGIPLIIVWSHFIDRRRPPV